MNKMKRFLESLMKGLITLSGGLSTLIILLITLFLFKEGLGVFSSSEVEEGYTLVVRSDNTIRTLSSTQIKEIYDYDITSWQKLGAVSASDEIIPVDIDYILSQYTDAELGEDFQYLPDKIAETVANEPGILAMVPTEFTNFDNKNIKRVETGNIKPSDFFGGTDWMPTAVPAPQFGILPLLLGTLLVSLLAILFALPPGIGVAIYLAELASPVLHKFLKPTVELLAGIPSVVYGFFGLTVIAPLLQKVLNLPVGETALTGGIVLAIMALPTIITIAEDAIRTAPQSIREASLALGASKWQTIYKVILPYSASGISAAVVLGIGRTIGETMAVLMVTGNAAVIPHSIAEPVRTIPATIAAELGEAPTDSVHYKALFLLAGILFLLTLLLSIFGEIMSNSKRIKSL